MKSIAENWRLAVVNCDATISEVIKSLEVSGLQIVLMASQDNFLVGTITDGDVRRGILKGSRLDSKAIDIANKKPLVAPLGVGDETVFSLMTANKIHQLPIIDAEQKLAGLHVLDMIIAPTSLPNFMVIMAGGKGLRLRPYTENCPKPMLEVGGKPIIEHIIEGAVAKGIQNFILAVHYLGDVIKNHFGDGSKFGVNIHYLNEESPLGTAGALSLIQERLEHPFIVINGDVMTAVNYSELLEFHNRQGATGTMAVQYYELRNPFGIVKTQGIDIVGFEEKPVYRSHINAGIYVLSPNALTFLTHDQYCDMPSLLITMKNKDCRVVAYPIHEAWMDIGRPHDLDLARQSSINLKRK